MILITLFTIKIPNVNKDLDKEINVNKGRLMNLMLLMLASNCLIPLHLFLNLQHLLAINGYKDPYLSLLISLIKKEMN